MSSKLAILRIYLHRRRDKSRPGLFGRLFPSSLTRHLAEQALAAGIPFASVTLSNHGYVQGATRVEHGRTEIESEALPACVELVGPSDALHAFVRAHDADLVDATLVMLEGIQVTLETHHRASTPPAAE
jgi:Uncharacterized ACR, COG1993